MGGTGTAARAAGQASQAIFIYSRDQHPSALDKCVVVTGKVGEFKTSTQLAASTIKESDNPAVDCGEKPRPITDAIPTDPAQREANEHMLFQPSGDYTVTNNYELSSYGSVDLVAGDKPLYQATQMVAPGPDAVAYEENNKRQVNTLDDGSTRNYFTSDQAKDVPLPYLSSAEGIKSLRTGDVVHFQQPAVLSFNFDKWGLQPTGEITGATGRGALPIEWADSRPAEVNGPENVGGDLSLASFNVLNYFTDLGKDEPGCKAYRDRDGNPVTTDYCTVRGAYTEQAFHDQQAKIVRAINTLNVSVLGLEEIENSAKFGHDRDASLRNLVDALNAAGGNWKYVPSPASLPGSEDVIRTAFIYNPDKLSPVGQSRILDHEAFTDIARQPLAQEFQVAGAGRMVAVVNHFKSKGSVARGDADTGDGQGNNARLRKEMSVQLTQWLKEQKDWAELPQFVMGDLNSYAREDALRVLEDAGFSNVEDRFDAGSSYQYAGRVGSLDHVLGNAAAMKLVTGADVWDINSDEATSFEYSRRNYNVVDFYAPDVFRSSDHDPIKVGLTAPTAQGSDGGDGHGDGGSGGNGNGGDTGQPGQPGTGGSNGSGGSGGTGGGSNGGSTGGVTGSVQSAWEFHHIPAAACPRGSDRWNHRSIPRRCSSRWSPWRALRLRCEPRVFLVSRPLVLAVEVLSAGLHDTALVAAHEPVDALLGGTVRPVIGVHLLARRLLDRVITDGLRCLDGLLNLLLGQGFEYRVLSLVCVCCPQARVAVRLQLELDGVGVSTGVVVIGKPQRSLQVLDVVAELVGGHIHL